MIAEGLIQPNEGPVENRHPANQKAGKVMDLPGSLVEGANPDTLGAVHPSRTPVGVTSLGVDVPFQDAGVIGKIVAPSRHLAAGKSL